MSIQPEEVPEEVVIARGSTNNQKRLHLPDPNNESMPVCDTVLSEKQGSAGHASGLRGAGERWHRKSVSVYPVVWRVWCQRCVEWERENTNGEEVRGGDSR